MDKESETKVRAHFEKKIRFTADSTVNGLKKFDPENQKHRKMVIDRLIDIADDVYRGSGPDLSSHRQLNDSWSITYTTVTGDTADKNYISPIEVLSPFNSSAIKKVEIRHAGSGV